MGSLLTRISDVDAALAGDLKAAAVAYAGLGLAVFPVHGINDSGRCTCGKDCGRNAGKHPRTVNGLRDATLDPDQIRSWWRCCPDANPAVATGGRSGVWILDIDPDQGGEAAMADLEAAHRLDEPTWCVETGGGGLHLWFRRDGVTIRSSAGRLGAGLDVRGEGGYVVVPPSLHRAGDPYRWAAAWHPARVDLAPAPPWLLQLVMDGRSESLVPSDGFSIGGQVRGNYSASPTVVGEGARNATLTSLAGAMRRQGAGERGIVAALLVENHERCRPMLAEAEVARIARSVCRYAPASTEPLNRAAHRPHGFVEFVGGQAVTR